MRIGDQPIEQFSEVGTHFDRLALYLCNDVTVIGNVVLGFPRHASASHLKSGADFFRRQGAVCSGFPRGVLHHLPVPWVFTN